MLHYTTSLGGSSTGGESYSTTGVTFDGTNDYLSVASLTGESNSALFSCSFWINNTTGGSNDVIYACYQTVNARFYISINSNIIYCVGRDTSGTQRVSLNSSALSAAWHHVLISFDVGNAYSNLYIDDQSDKTVSFNGASAIHFASAGTKSIGSTNGGNLLAADLADFWLQYGTYIDFSDVDNRRKFVTSLVTPVNLGEDGSLPTGSSPIVYQTGPVDTWHTNVGTGGGWTENGALTASSTNPGD